MFSVPSVACTLRRRFSIMGDGCLVVFFSAVGAVRSVGR